MSSATHSGGQPGSSGKHLAMFNEKCRNFLGGSTSRWPRTEDVGSVDRVATGALV